MLVDMNSDARRQFEATFRTYGVCILQSEKAIDMTAYGEELFGDTVRSHKCCNPKGEVIIDPLADVAPPNVKKTDQEHELHTDDSYSAKPSSVLTLRCEIAAPSGGDSVLVSGHAMYEAARRDLKPEELAALFEPCLLVDCVYPGHESEEAWLRLFTRRADGRVSVRWRSRDSAGQGAELKQIAPAAVRGFEYLEQFVKAEENRFVAKILPGQTVVIDNAALLHARTAYPSTERRRLIRMNFDGDKGSLCAQYGFPTPLPVQSRL
jgi:alpha-ketoglutarate-dependent taurine dioxygenase